MSVRDISIILATVFLLITNLAQASEPPCESIDLESGKVSIKQTAGSIDVHFGESDKYSIVELGSAFGCVSMKKFGKDNFLVQVDRGLKGTSSIVHTTSALEFKIQEKKIVLVNEYPIKQEIYRDGQWQEYIE